MPGDMSDIQQLLDNVPSTNEELKQIRKEIRQKAVRKVEKNFILKALENNQWNVTQAAQNVGLQRSNFHNLMKKYGITLQRRR
jgi:transcriptional regulator of acetoin/glycerol metabolism